MSKLVLDDLASLSNEQSALSKLNSNWQKIEDALENTLSRDGTSPNSMSDDLDMNSNRVINLPAAASDTEPVRKAEFDQTLIAAGIPIDGEYLVRSSNSLLTSERVVTNSDSVVADWSTDAGQVRFKRAALTGDVVASQDSNVTELTAQAKTYINVLKYGASTALSDNSVAFQAAIDDAYAAGGGVVFVPAGAYKLTAQVTIKSGVTVAGIGWRFDQNSNTGQTGTVFEIRWGSGVGSVDDPARAAFILNGNAAIRSVLITYPLQATDDFTPDEYGPTLKLYEASTYAARPYLNNVCIEDVMLHKCFCGIDMRGTKAGLISAPPDGNNYLKLMTTHRIRKVLIAPLRYGVRIDNVTDWSIFEDIEVQPGYLAPVGTYALGASLRDYAQKNCAAFELGTCDWLKLNSCTAWAVNYAVVIAGRGPFTFIGCEFDACRNGNFFFTGNCSPTLFEAVGCTFTTFDALEDANNGSRVSSFVAVIGPNTTVTSVAFDSCRLFGPSKGWLWADQTVRTVTRFALRNCTTSTNYWGGMSADYAIKAGAAAGFSDAIIVGNTFTGLAGIYDGTITNLVTDNNITDSGAFTSAPSSAEFLVKTANGGLSAERVVGASTSISPDWSVAGEVCFKRSALTGDVTASDDSNATTIANDAVTYAKMQNVSATSRVVGRKTAGAGDPEECTLSEILDFVGSTAQGDILYRGSSGWTRLAAGTAGYSLVTGGAGANPSYAARREVLTANRTYYVRTDGSDSNTGLVNNAGGAFLTLQKAWNVILTLDLNGYVATVAIGHSGQTFTAGLSMTSPPVGGLVTIDLGGSTISTTSANAIRLTTLATVTVQNGTLQTSTSGYGIHVTGHGAKVTLGSSLIFGACASGHMRVDVGGAIQGSSAYTVTGQALQHYLALTGGVIDVSSTTVTLSGVQTYTTFAQAESGGVISAYGMTYSGGTISGTRYSASLNAVINTYGGGASVFPGSVAGGTATGGQYN